MKRIFDGLYKNDHCGDTWKAENLYATALKFRLLRQHRYVSLKVFIETEKKKKKKRDIDTWIQFSKYYNLVLR